MAATEFDLGIIAHHDPGCYRGFIESVKAETLTYKYVRMYPAKTTYKVLCMT